MVGRAMRRVRGAVNMLGAVTTVVLQVAAQASPGLVAGPVALPLVLPPSPALAQLAVGAAQVNDNISEYQLDPDDLFGAFGPFNPADPNAALFIRLPERTETITPQDLFGGRAPDVGDAVWSTSDPGTLATEAAGRRSALERAVSPEGDAVRIVNELDMVPDLWEDPLWRSTYEVVNQGVGLRELIADCEVMRTVLPGRGEEVFLSDRRRCREVDFDEPPPVVANHRYNTRIYDHLDGPENIAPCAGIENCVDIWIGTVGNNYLASPGTCTIFTEFTEFQWLHPESIVSATIVEAVFDDLFRISVGESTVWMGPHGWFPEPGTRSCELRRNWNINPNVDVTAQIRAADGRIAFQTETAVHGFGEGYARLRIMFDPSRIVQSSWSFDEAAYAQLLSLVGDGACTLNTVCTSLPTVPGGCFPDSFDTICVDDLAPPPFAGVPRECLAAQVSVDCAAFTAGTLCFPDVTAPSGQTCVEVDLSRGDACSRLEADPACGLVFRECAAGGVVGGSCRVFERTYECGSTVSVPGGEITETVRCEGDIGCVGDACVLDGSRRSTSFAEVATNLEALEAMTHDVNCDLGTTASLEDCRVFEGEPNQCRDSFFGMYNCCDSPGGISLADYLRLAGATVSAARATDALLFANAGTSAFSEFLSPVFDSFGSAQAAAGQAWSALQTPFVQMWNGVTGQTVQVAEFAVGGVIDAVANQLIESAARFTLDTFGSAATNFLFQSAGAVPGPAVGPAGLASSLQLAPAVTTAFTLIGLAFSAYTIATFLLEMIFACEENELELATKRELRSVTYLGRYCSIRTPFNCLQYSNAYCQYNSPLSRIVMEQVARQISWDYGTPRDPRCPSLALMAVDTVDWSAIDLSEWTGILVQSGQLPGIGDIDVDSLTGERSTLGQALSGVRLDAIDRAEERGRGIEIDNIRRAAAGAPPR